MRKHVALIVAVAFTPISAVVGAPALPPERPVNQTLAVEIGITGELVRAGHPPIIDTSEMKDYLVSQFNRIKRDAEKAKVKFEPAIEIRAYEHSAFSGFTRFVEVAKSAGFDRIRFGSIASK